MFDCAICGKNIIGFFKIIKNSLTVLVDKHIFLLFGIYILAHIPWYVDASLNFVGYFPGGSELISSVFLKTISLLTIFFALFYIIVVGCRFFVKKSKYREEFFYKNLFQDYKSTFAVFIVSIVFIFSGILALILPGIYILMALFCVFPIVVIEKGGCFEAIIKSWDVTEGYKLQIFGLILIIIFTYIILLKILFIFSDALGFLTNYDSLVGLLIVSFLSETIKYFCFIWFLSLQSVLYKKLSN